MVYCASCAYVLLSAAMAPCNYSLYFLGGSQAEN